MEINGEAPSRSTRGTLVEYTHAHTHTYMHTRTRTHIHTRFYLPLSTIRTRCKVTRVALREKRGSAFPGTYAIIPRYIRTTLLAT